VGLTWKSHCVQVVMAQHLAFICRGKIYGGISSAFREETLNDSLHCRHSMR